MTCVRYEPLLYFLFFSLTFIRAFAYPDLQRQLFQAGRFPSWSLRAALCGREQQGRRDAGRQARPDHLAGDAGEIEQRNACAPYSFLRSVNLRDGDLRWMCTV